jgi:signal transduction histidine kinase
VLATPGNNLAQGFEAVALSDVLGDVVSELPTPDRARVQLKTLTDGLVRGDVDLLRSLLVNGLQNALRFSSASVTATLESVAAGGVVLELRDQGPGIAPELRERVFHPFYRISRSRGVGHGLGLALSSHIARVHSGEACFVDVAKGACLRISLPGWAP